MLEAQQRSFVSLEMTVGSLDARRWSGHGRYDRKVAKLLFVRHKYKTGSVPWDCLTNHESILATVITARDCS